MVQVLQIPLKQPLSWPLVALETRKAQPNLSKKV